MTKCANDMNDWEFLAWVLRSGEPRSLGQIMQESYEVRGCRMTVHSRASDLRGRGYDIANFNDPSRHPRDRSMYQLLGGPSEPLEEEVTVAPGEQTALC